MRESRSLTFIHRLRLGHSDIHVAISDTSYWLACRPIRSQCSNHLRPLPPHCA